MWEFLVDAYLLEIMGEELWMRRCVRRWAFVELVGMQFGESSLYVGKRDF